jgi:hypothetical protein
MSRLVLRYLESGAEIVSLARDHQEIARAAVPELV